jgi:hypothetical protein
MIDDHETFYLTWEGQQFIRGYDNMIRHATPRHATPRHATPRLNVTVDEI